MHNSLIVGVFILIFVVQYKVPWEDSFPELVLYKSELKSSTHTAGFYLTF